MFETPTATSSRSDPRRGELTSPPLNGGAGAPAGSGLPLESSSEVEPLLRGDPRGKSSQSVHIYWDKNPLTDLASTKRRSWFELRPLASTRSTGECWRSNQEPPRGAASPASRPRPGPPPLPTAVGHRRSAPWASPCGQGGLRYRTAREPHALAATSGRRGGCRPESCPRMLLQECDRFVDHRRSPVVVAAVPEQQLLALPRNRLAPRRERTRPGSDRTDRC
jgi:hypothetical protein